MMWALKPPVQDKTRNVSFEVSYLLHCLLMYARKGPAGCSRDCGRHTRSCCGLAQSRRLVGIGSAANVSAVA